MNEQKKPAAEKLINCDICLKEIPVSSAKVVESADYVHHFCGLECFEKWKKQEHKTKT